jgi:predicted O-methyltransferase YrrM
MGIIKALFRHTVGAFASEQMRVMERWQTNPLFILRKQATEEAAAYIKKHSQNAVLFDNRFDLLKYALSAAQKGLVLEFGVNRGDSLRVIASHTTQPVHGFDTFTGLPTDGGGTHWVQHQFDQKGKLPSMPAHVVLHIGLFEDTLKKFCKDEPSRIAFMHVDCDLYESTKVIFNHLGNRLSKDSIIVFDEYFNYPNWAKGEYLAFQEFIRSSNLEYEYVAFGRAQVCVRLI